MTLHQVLGAANIGSYTSQITCSPPDGFSSNEDGRGGTYEVPAIPVAVSCTITNTRTSATMTLQKEWVTATAGDTAALSIDGATSGSGFVVATVPASGTGLSTDKATLTLLSGSTVTVHEVLGAANAGSYTSHANCNQPGLTPDGDGRGGTFRVQAAANPVSCTITNTGSSGTGPLVPPVKPPKPGASGKPTPESGSSSADPPPPRGRC